MAEVTLKNLRTNIRYVILEANKNFTGDSGTYEVRLQRCKSYTVEFQNCTYIIPPIAPGRYRRGLVFLGGGVVVCWFWLFACLVLVLFFLTRSNSAFLDFLVCSCLFRQKVFILHAWLARYFAF